MRRLDGMGWLLLALAAGSLANAFWMLAGPMHWYRELPAAVPDTGPFNPHFVRDIGCAFLTVGVALAWAALAPRLRFALVAVALLFYAAHALLHVYDTAVGNLPHTHWWLDLPGVYLPAALLFLLTWRLRRREGDLHATPARR
jgi:hypothetical protein